jgi:hypothetical protein
MGQANFFRSFLVANIEQKCAKRLKVYKKRKNMKHSQSIPPIEMIYTGICTTDT